MLARDIFTIIVPKKNNYVTEKVTREVFFYTLASYYGDVPKKSVMTLKWGNHFRMPSQLKLPDFKNRLKIKLSYYPNDPTVRFRKIISFFESDILKSWGSVFKSNCKPELLSICKVTFYETSGRLILRPNANKFCCNINREHKRNGIYFLINIAQFCFTQKCLDENCVGFQSETFPLDPALFFTRYKRKERFWQDHKVLKKRRDM